MPAALPRRRAWLLGALVVVGGLAGGAGTAQLLTTARWGDEPADARGTTTPASIPAPTPTLAALTTPAPAPAPTATPTPTPAPAPTPTFDLTALSTTDPASLWVVVNKQHPIDPLRYEPADLVGVMGTRLRAVVVPDLTAMVAAARADGVRLGVRTGYRTYDQQAAIRADVVRRRGAERAENYSARAGYSEHETGLSLDLSSTSRPSCDLSICFADTVEAHWVAAHAAEYGFLVRYTAANTAVTGYSPEGWHLRYVGRELAAWMAAGGVGSLEEALGVTGGPEYATG